MLGAVEGVVPKANGAALPVPEVVEVVEEPVGLNPPKAGVELAGVELLDVAGVPNPKPPVVVVDVEGWVVEGAVGLKLNMLPAAGVLELVVEELVPELAPKANPTVVGVEVVLAGLSVATVVIALVNNVLPVCDKAGRVAVVVAEVVEAGWLVLGAPKVKVLPPVVEAAGVLVEGALVEAVGLKLNIPVVDGAVVDEVLGCDAVVAGVVVEAVAVTAGKFIVKPPVVLAAGVVVEVVLEAVLVVEGVGLKAKDGVVVAVEVVDAGVVVVEVVVLVLEGVLLKLKLVVDGAVVEVVLACDEELVEVPAVGVNEKDGVVVEAVLEVAAGVVVLVVDG